MAGLHANGSLGTEDPGSAPVSSAGETTTISGATETNNNNNNSAVSFLPGESIEARYGGEATFYPGKIGFVHEDTQTCDIIYDDGDAESGVPFALIRKVQAAVAGSNSVVSVSSSGGSGDNSSSSGSGNSTTFAVGTEVEVRGFKGGWRPGTVSTVREEGSFDVTLQDGTVEKGVPPSLVRLKGDASDNTSGGNQPAKDGAAKPAADQVKIATAHAALNLKATTKKEKELRDELEMLLKAYDRQMRTVDKNVQKIASLKTKITDLEKVFSDGASPPVA